MLTMRIHRSDGSVISTVEIAAVASPDIFVCPDCDTITPGTVCRYANYASHP